MTSDSSREKEMQEALEYFELVKKELRKREEKLAICRAEMAALSDSAGSMRPDKFVVAGDPMLIRSASESRKEINRQLQELQKKLPDLEADVSSAKERLVMAQEDIEELQR